MNNGSGRNSEDELIEILTGYLSDPDTQFTEEQLEDIRARLDKALAARDEREAMDCESRKLKEKRDMIRIRRQQQKILMQAEEERARKEKAEREQREIEMWKKYLREQEEKKRRRKELAETRREKRIQREKERRAKAKEAERLRREEERRRSKEEEEKRRAHVKEVTCMELPLDWSDPFACDARAVGVHVESVSDGLIRSLTTLGRVDIEYIASITGFDCVTVIDLLRGSIYQDPEQWNECFYRGWQTAEEYLSGNLSRKLRTAVEANEYYGGYFSDNVEAIKEVIPQSAAADKIYATLGSPWLPTEVIDDFIEHLFEGCYISWYEYSREDLAVKHNELTGTWEIPHKTRYSVFVKNSNTYGVEGMNALHIMENTLNMIPVKITKEERCPTAKSGVRRVIDREKTAQAAEKQRLMIKEFRDWVWKDKARREKLESIFEERYGCVRRRIFDGSFLEFPGMSEDIELYQYQKNAVARIIFSPNTLLAHDVGAGKTFEMIAAGQELRRMGLSSKNMYVVPNNIVGQWKSIFLSMYPDAKLLCVDSYSFRADKRQSVLESIRDDDYDGIIIAYSCFDMIPVSREYLAEEIEEKQRALSASRRDPRRSTKGLDRRNESLAKEKEDIFKEKEPELVCFDELGVTRLFVDEAHNYKNVPISTKVGNVYGISRSGSKKCRDMMTKVHMVQKYNNGGGVVFATGTPITNSVTDAFIMQKYLQDGELALLDIASFDGWIGMFAEKTTEFEIDVDTSGYRLATRFARFHNLPELTALLASFADFYTIEDPDGMPEADGRIDMLTGKPPELAKFLETITKRAEDVRKGAVSRKDDNMLLITTDGRKAALDMRLVTPSVVPSGKTKSDLCAEKAAEIYFRYNGEKLTQLIFCDSSTPKAGFNIYDEVKLGLTKRGVPADEIAYVHDATSEKERDRLFEKMRLGEVRVLIGSTFKLGLGVNVQDRLIALHHIDVPWRPADMTQREGRIIRRGNINKKVFIYRYITEGSFDSYSWQLLETKQRFIADLLSGSICERSGSDIENTVLDYAEVKALAVGNPLIKERVKAANELSRFRMLQKSYIESRMRLELELSEMPAKRRGFEENLRISEEDRDRYARWKEKHPAAAEGSRKTAEAEARKALRESLNEALNGNEFAPENRVFGEYRGFEIILPANMPSDKPYVWLRSAEREPSDNAKMHFVEMGGSGTGNLIRIDNYLEKLGEHCEKLRRGIAGLDKRGNDIKEELSCDKGFSEQIEYYSEKVRELDEKLEVGKK